MKTIISLLTATALLVGCASAPKMSYQQKNLHYRQYIATNNLPSLNKIRSFSYSGWQSLTDNYLIISTSFKKKYLIEIKGFCTNLTFAYRIVINQSSHSSLSKNFDSISTLESPRQKCFIKNIHQISKAQVQEMTKATEVKEATNTTNITKDSQDQKENNQQ